MQYLVQYGTPTRITEREELPEAKKALGSIVLVGVILINALLRTKIIFRFLLQLI